MLMIIITYLVVRTAAGVRLQTVRGFEEASYYLSTQLMMIRSLSQKKPATTS
jgi:hypothetical protein